MTTGTGHKPSSSAASCFLKKSFAFIVQIISLIKFSCGKQYLLVGKDYSSYESINSPAHCEVTLGKKNTNICGREQERKLSFSYTVTKDRMHKIYETNL